jgi:hypothetical protein
MSDSGPGQRKPRPPAPASDRELVSLLALAASQIEVALREAEAPVAVLAEIVAGLGPGAEAERATTALQFHDRLVQRLSHVQETLASLAKFVGARSHVGPASNWARLRDSIRGRFSMEQERVMFDLLVGGATPDQVLAALTDLRSGGAASHVDLF